MEALTPKDPDTDAWYFIDWAPRLIRPWQPDWEYAAGIIVRPGRSTGYFYEAEIAGRSQADELGWPTTPGVTRRDGSVVWVTRDPAALALSAITASVWEVPSDLAEVSSVIDGYVTSVLLSGGTDGESYQVLNTITFGGLTDDQTITVKVAHT